MSAVRELRTNLASMPIAADARYEIDHRLKLKDTQFGEALRLAAGVQLDAIARDGIVVPRPERAGRPDDRQPQRHRSR